MSGGGTGPLKPGNRSIYVEKVLNPAKAVYALKNKRGLQF
jgi:hypothetical protein